MRTILFRSTRTRSGGLAPRTRSSVALATVLSALALLGAACDGGAGSTDATPGGDDADPTGIPSEGVELTYSFVPGDVLTYELDLEQRMVLESEGSAAAVTDGDVPASADVTLTAQGEFVYTISEGPRPGTVQIDIEGTFDEVAVEGTADGEPVDDPDDLDQIGEIQPVSTSVVVDDRGKVIEEATTPADPFGLGNSPLMGLAGDLGGIVGPILPADPVGAGEIWTETFQEAGMGDEPVETTVTSRLTGADTIDDTEDLAEGYVVESDSETGEAEVDLTDFFGGFMGAFTDPEDEATQSSIQELIDQLVFRVAIDPSTSKTTALFDPEAGQTVSAESTSTSSIHMEVALPDETSGDIERFDMDLDVDQSTAFRLVSDGPA